jgi:hypothetical protein
VPGARISWGLIFAEWWWAFVLLTSWVLVGNLRPGFGAGVDGFGRFGPAACVCVHRIVPPVRGRSVIGRSALELGRILCGVDFAARLFGKHRSREPGPGTGTGTCGCAHVAGGGACLALDLGVLPFWQLRWCNGPCSYAEFGR